MKIVIVSENNGIKNNTEKKYNQPADFVDTKGTNYVIVDKPIIKRKGEMTGSDSKTWDKHVADDYYSSEHHWVKWVTYKFRDTIDTTKIDHLGYAYYCGGFLFYYDEIVRNGSVDHKITFHWSHGQGDKLLSIFITPGPNVDLKKYPHLHGEDKPQQYYFRDNAHDEYLSPRSGGIDPQPPPPPPPPPQYS